MLNAEQEVGEGHGGRLFELDSEGVRALECGQKDNVSTILKKRTGGKQRGKDLSKPKMSAYEKIRERNIAEREEVLADLQIDFSQINSNLEMEVDKQKGNRRDAGN